jgi:hypothetical protein
MVFARETLAADCGRRIVCSDSGLFDSKECVAAWRVSHASSPGEVYTLRAYLERCGEPGFRRGRGTR